MTDAQLLTLILGFTGIFTAVGLIAYIEMKYWKVGFGAHYEQWKNRKK